MATPFKLKRSAVSGKRPDLGDLQLGELALNFYDGHLFARRETNGVGIADTVSILTPWIENFGGSQISYIGDVGITGFTTFTGSVSITGSLSITGGSSLGIDIETRHFKASGISTFVGIATAESTLFANQLSVSGVTTFFNDVTLSGSSTDLVVGGTIRSKNLHSNGTPLEIRGGGNTTTRPGILLPQNSTGDIEILGYNGGSGDIILDTRGSGNLELKHNGNIQATIDSVGIAFTDNVQARFGSGQDLKIYHNSLDSWIQNTGSGNLKIAGDDVEILSAGGASKITATTGGSVDLYYDGSKKFETTGYGVTVIGGLEVSGIATYKDTTDNILGDPDTGSIQIDGGLGVNKNVSIGGSFYVGGYSEFVGVVTFRGGTINIGDADSDDVNIGGEFVSSLIPNADGTYNLGSTAKRWKNGNFSGILTTNNLYASGITTTVQFNVGVGGTVITTTDAGNVGINSTQPSYSLDVVGDINSSTDLKINGTSVLSLTASQDDIVALAIALG